MAPLRLNGMEAEPRDDGSGYNTGEDSKYSGGQFRGGQNPPSESRDGGLTDDDNSGDGGISGPSSSDGDIKARTNQRPKIIDPVRSHQKPNDLLWPEGIRQRRAGEDRSSTANTNFGGHRIECGGALAGIEKEKIDAYRQAKSPEERASLLARIIGSESSSSSASFDREEGVRNALEEIRGHSKNTDEPVELDQSNDIERSTTPTSRSIVQVPSGAEGAEHVLEDLEHNNEIIKQAVDDLVRFTRGSKTMVCLRACNYMEITEEASVLLANNTGGDFSKRILLLNNARVPNHLIIPAVGEQDRATSVLPTIIPSGVRTTFDGVTTTAPRRVPDQEENRKVRTLIREAFALNYGDEDGNLPSYLLEADASLDALRESGAPVTAKAVNAIFAKIEEWKSENPDPKIPVVRHPQIPNSLAKALAEHPVLATSDEIQRRNMTRLSEEADENLTSPEKALYSTLSNHASRIDRQRILSAAILASSTFAFTLFKKLNAPDDNVTNIITCIFVGALTGALISGEVREMQEIAANNPNAHLIGATIGGSVGASNALAISYTDMTTSVLVFSFVTLVSGIAFGSDIKNFNSATALAHAREALNDWNGGTADRAVASLQQAQRTDHAAIDSLNDLFTSFASREEGTEVDQQAISKPRVTPTQIQEFLINQIEERIADREDLIKRLQNKIAVIKARSTWGWFF